MTDNILVALRRRDRAEAIIPYVEKLVPPGGKVTFLVPYPGNLFSYLREHWIESESASKAMVQAERLRERYRWSAQKAEACAKIAPARAALQEKNIIVEVDLYSGSLAGRLRKLAAAGAVNWVLVPARKSTWSLRSLKPSAAPDRKCGMVEAYLIRLG